MQAAHRGFKIKGLGEIAIRCADVGAMLRFYRDTLGLAVLSGDADSDIVFLATGGPGHAGHTQVLALFARGAGRPEIHPHGAAPPATGAASSLHHIALNIDFAAQEAAMDWYAAQGLEFTVQQFGWIGWRGIFTRDPEGNTVELVAFDAAMLDHTQDEDR